MSTQPPLTQMAHGAGCGCKIAPGVLTEILASMPVPIADPNVLVGNHDMDDAAVYRLDDGTAIVATLDFFTPIVDDPATFGRIAATNAINDVYAMGGTPLLALAVVGYPKDGDLDVLGEILRGGVAAAADHGIGVLGGHSIDDPEPKYGLAVIGRVSPDAVMTNAAGRPGDILVLTKALGTGIAVAAAKASQPGAAHAAAVAQMCVSNRAAAEAAGEVGIRCATDVTGFGLIGHLRELALASGVGAAIRIDKIPPIQGVLELIAEGNLPGAIDRNRAHLEQFVDFDDGVVADARTLLFDPQTSGGLLIACPRADLDHLHEALLARGVRGWPIGQLLPEPAGRIGVISPLTARRAREAPTETRTQS